jgi:hypothetical protein
MKTLDPFLYKFGNLSNSLIKSFVNENMDFFEEDVVIMEWLNVLEMAVKFENDDSENNSSNRIRQKSISGPMSPSSSPEKTKSKPATTQDPMPKNSVSKFKEMSKHIYGKLERRKRKYKKKQIEYIGWHYQEANEAKVRDLIDVIAILNKSEENEKFLEYLFKTSFMQPDSDIFDHLIYSAVKEYAVPVLFAQGQPIFYNPAVKTLFLYEAYFKITTPSFDLVFDKFKNLI